MSETKSPEAKFEDELLINDCLAAAEALDRALHLPPQQLTQQADMAERMVVRARDNLIHRLRVDGNSANGARWRKMLDQLNAALSLIIAIEYPLAAVQRQPAEQARDILKNLVDKAPR